MKLPLFFLCAALLLPGLRAQDRAALRQIFDGKLEECALEEQLQAVRVGRLYSDSLHALNERAQGAGNLDLLSAIMEEQARFEREKTPSAALSAEADLKGLQEILRREWQAAARVRAEKVLTLARHYDQALDVLQKDLVTRGDIDTALAVREERSGISALPAVAEAAALLAAGADPQPSTRGAPPAGAKRLGQRYFKIIEGPLGGEAARARAAEMGGRLASADTKEVFDLLREMMMKSEARTAYIGLKRNPAPLNWVWENGKPLTFARWAPGEPNNEAEMFVIMHRRRGWSDVGGKTKMAFIVEWGP